MTEIHFIIKYLIKIILYKINTPKQRWVLCYIYFLKGNYKVKSWHTENGQIFGFPLVAFFNRIFMSLLNKQKIKTAKRHKYLQLIWCIAHYLFIFNKQNRLMQKYLNPKHRDYKFSLSCMAVPQFPDDKKMSPVLKTNAAIYCLAVRKVCLLWNHC